MAKYKIMSYEPATGNKDGIIYTIEADDFRCMSDNIVEFFNRTEVALVTQVVGAINLKRAWIRRIKKEKE